MDMGAYLCIASNGHPPTVSKRILVSVDFPPMLWIPHQLIGANIGSQVTLECFTEAHPTSLNYWTRGDSNMIYDSDKYKIENRMGNPEYKIHMLLTVRHLEEEDFGTYRCVAKNPRGETDGSIKVYNSGPPPTTTEVPSAKENVDEKNENGGKKIAKKKKKRPDALKTNEVETDDSTSEEESSFRNELKVFGSFGRSYDSSTATAGINIHVIIFCTCWICLSIFPVSYIYPYLDKFVPIS
ncbi:UNVERIFIED_CONTAM: hypothetical protein RMT77_007748 [Armadillidium vulgare]